MKESIQYEIMHAMLDQHIDTQKELAKKAGISEQTMTQVMWGRRVSLRTLEKLADALKINITKLLIVD